MSRLSRLKPSGTGGWLVVSSLLLALLISPFALASGEGNPLKGGVRNPGTNESQSLTRETEIIANTGTYGTRQSNKSDNGGGAIYGCRSKAGGSAANNEPCIRANNLNDGLAFEFETDGLLLGTLTTSKPGDQSRPFTTNATGVATGLNADRVDGKNAEELRDEARAGLQGEVLFAAQADNTATGRGLSGAGQRTAEGVYRVDFARDISKCARTATVTGGDEPATISVTQPAGDNDSLIVRTHAQPGAGGDFALANRAFHLTVTC